MGQYDQLDKYFAENKVEVKLFPSSGVRRFVDFNSLVQFIEEEWDFWKNNAAHRLSNIQAKYSHINALKDQTINHYSNKQIDNALPSLRNLINQLNQGNYLLYSKSLESELLLNCYTKNAECGNGAFDFFFNQINNAYFSNKGYIEGVFKAFLFNESLASESDRIKSENKSLGKLRSEYQNIISEHYQEFKNKNDELRITLDEFNKNITSWFEESKQSFVTSQNEREASFKSLMDEKLNKFNDLEHAYKEKLKLEGPAKYWDELYNEYQVKGKWWRRWAVVFSFFLAFYLSAILYNLPERLINNDTFSHQNLKGTIILAVIVSVFVYLIRLFVKLSTSAYHLSRDAKERHQLTYFYLALINDNDKTVSEKEREIILNSLFSRADTGLLKGDSTPAFPGGMLETILKNGKG